MVAPPSRIRVAAIAAFAVGAVISFLVVRSAGGTQEVAAATTTTTVPVAFFAEEDELVLGQAVLVPGVLDIADGEVTFRYDLVGLAPLAGVEPVATFEPFQGIVEIPAAELATVYPEEWLLETGSGNVAGVTTNPEARVARFPIGDASDLGRVTGLRLTAYSLRVPLDVDLLASEGGAPVEVAPGIDVRVLNITEQGRTTIIQTELLAANPHDVDGLEIEGAGPGWIASVREAEGRPRWNLTYDGVDPPLPVPLTLRGAFWLDAGEGGAISLERDS